MHTKPILMLLICALLILKSEGQVQGSISDADTQSLRLFNTGQWKTLMHLGKANIASGNTSALLRMRVGYAAFMLGNNSQSLLQYQTVFREDPDNNIALYYIYLNNLYLNNTIASRFYEQKLPGSIKTPEQMKATKISGLQAEFSNKMPADSARRNAQYARIGLNVDLGYRFQLQQSAAFYTLMVNAATTNYNKVGYLRLRQPEYYAKVIYSATGRLSILGAYHYISDRFTDTTFNTHILLAGIKYTSPYFSVQANASSGNFIKNYAQYDGIITIYPLGNVNLYSISRISIGTQTNFTQVLGAKLTKGFWLEGNMTLGTSNYLFDNDALYVKNDPDPLLFRSGVSAYTTLSKKLLFTVNYTFEQKQKFLTTNNYYYQHSINGGLSWKF